MSAVEAICVSLVGNQTLQLARQLTAAALNCCITSGHSDCTGVSIHETFANCNDVCLDGSAAQVGDCISAIDCFNNGGVPTSTPTGSLCATGTCDDDGAPCNGNDQSRCTDAVNATCVANSNSCHNQLLVNHDVGTCSDDPTQSCTPTDLGNCALGATCNTLALEPPGPAGSVLKCQASRRTGCNVFTSSVSCAASSSNCP